MRNLGKAIDSLIQIDPAFEGKLKPIKNKWRRWPDKTTEYWAEVLEFLNHESLVNHPQRNEIKDAINTKRRRKRELYSFETLLSSDVVVGPIPGNTADKIRKQDRKSIEIAKARVEAEMTRDFDLMSELIRRDSILDIETKKIWVALRDHFKLWQKPGSYNIRSSNGVLFLVAPQASPARFVKPGVISVDPALLKKFFRFMGMDLPPDLEGLIDGKN